MKYPLILILLFFICVSSAQEVTDISVTYSKKDASLEEIFRDLEEQYGIRFSYATSSIENTRMDANFENETISTVLEYLLAQDEMEYKIVSNNILLRKTDSYTETEDKRYHSSLHVRGKITNGQNSNVILDFATISVSNTSIGTYSDQDGKFDLEIPEQYLNQEIIVSYVGFEDEVYKISELENEYIMVSMNKGSFEFKEIMIVNKEKPMKIGGENNAIQMKKRTIQSNTSGVMGNDIARQIQMLPGISAHEDNSASIKIRGSNSDETLMILDGMPIYNANHYYGIFSSLNTAYIDSVNIFKNTYPIQYGGKTAGLVELFSSNEQASKVNGSVQLDLLTSSVSAAIPVTKNSTLSIAGRGTIKEVNNDQFNTVSSLRQNDTQIAFFSEKFDDRKNDPSFKFYDVNLKYLYQNENRDKFSINFFRSGDEVTNDFKISIRDLNENELKLVAIEDQSWFNTAASINYSKNVSSNLNWTSTAYVTSYSNQAITDFKLDKKYKPGQPPPPLNNPLTAELGSNQTNKLLDLSFDTHMNYTLNNQTFTLGLNGIHHDINYRFDDNKQNKLNGKDQFYELTGYAGYAMKLWDKLSLISGVRATYFSNLNQTKYSPRVLVQYPLTPRFLLKSSFHIENQVIRQFYYEYRGEPMELWVNAGQNNIPILRSENIMIGSTFRISPFTIDVEIYQKDMKGVLEYLIPNPGEASNNANQTRDYKLFRGDGLTKGIDIIISSGYKNYDTYLSYTLSKSEERYKEIFQNEYFASENDRRHQFKWVNSLSYHDFTFGLNAIYVSGRPYTDIRTVGPAGDVLNLDPKVRLKRVDPYHRIDISSSYNFKIGKFDSRVTASIFNLMNTKNIQYIQSVSTQVNANQNVQNIIIGNESELLNRTFNLGLSINF
ncbi:MAG: TonB-dependent receptor plug domain-containing protein [Saprospiraceae bacterium]|nr:TonB-dependent receptor plug domain-containing protein [Saprospiraceae bacterium]